MLCGQEALGGRDDSPPPGFTTESWGKDIGLHSPSSGTEVIYCSPEDEWYDESPEPDPHPRPPPSSACTTNSKRDIDECTTDSDFMSGPEGKPPSELDEKIADYHRKAKESRMLAMHHRRMEGNALQYVIAPCMYLRMPLHRGPVPGSAEREAGHGRTASAKVSPPIKLR